MIDVIIPVYNDQKNLPQALMSILLQETSIPIQVTIVDDCSKEGYSEVIKPFQDAISIQVLRMEENGGAGKARQKGINSTHGDYIFFLDADDLITDIDSLETLYQAILQGYDMISGGEYIEKDRISAVSDGELHGKLYRRSYLEEKKIQFNDTRVHEDNYFNSYVLLSGAKEKKIEKVFYYYRNNPSSVTNERKDLEFSRLETYLYNMKELREKIPVTDDNFDIVCYHILKKYKYFYKLSLTYTEEQKEQLKKWISIYDPMNLNLYGIFDTETLKKIISENIKKIKVD